VSGAQVTTWWGEHRIGHGKAGRFRIGPLILTATRLDNEWRLDRESSGDTSDTTVGVEVPIAPHEPTAAAVVSRFGDSDGSEQLELLPILPDRPVVTRPEHPMTVPPHQKVTVYVGSPLWLRVSDAERKHRLEELPAFRPSLTWWGSNTREGEVCYGTRTYGRLRLGEIVHYPHRVMTAVSIDNGADQPLLLERVLLPVRRLAVYATASGQLWTEAVTLERDPGELLATLHLGKKPPKQAGSAKRISAPRDPSSQKLLFHAFGSLFRGRG
jgi:hypothetical protein